MLMSKNVTNIIPRIEKNQKFLEHFDIQREHLHIKKEMNKRSFCFQKYSSIMYTEGNEELTGSFVCFYITLSVFVRGTGKLGVACAIDKSQRINCCI